MVRLRTVDGSCARRHIGLCDGFDEEGKCNCGAGTECKNSSASGLTAVASTIFVRVLLGGLLEKSGPRKVHVALLGLGALFVAMLAGSPGKNTWEVPAGSSGKGAREVPSGSPCKAPGRCLAHDGPKSGPRVRKGNDTQSIVDSQ
ncbi:unnamed protein product, partial [Prorocentrum cordatum]